GVRNNEITVRLLQQSTNITFEETVKLALAIESSKQEIHKQDNIKLKTSDTKSNSAKFKCFKCGKNNHKAYTGEVIKPVGKSRVKIKYENQTTDGDIYVLNGIRVKLLSLWEKAELRSSKIPKRECKLQTTEIWHPNCIQSTNYYEKIYHLRKGVYTWNSQCEKVFTELKKEISSDKVLIPYTPEERN
ncbi:hypothetical protein QE152_g4988, partial [Popillia japonica]